jgi:hypothetical protein
MVAVWRSMGWGCTVVSLLAMGCGAAAESGGLEGDAVELAQDEDGEQADEGEGGGASEARGGADVDEPGAVVDGQPIAAPIKCGGHFPLCPPGMECAPIRRVEDETAFGYCK